MAGDVQQVEVAEALRFERRFFVALESGTSAHLYYFTRDTDKVPSKCILLRGATVRREPRTVGTWRTRSGSFAPSPSSTIKSSVRTLSGGGGGRTQLVLTTQGQHSDTSSRRDEVKATFVLRSDGADDAEDCNEADLAEWEATLSALARQR